MKTTINKMMTWYAGNIPKWNEDIENIQLTNTMSFNNKHAQDKEKWGEDVIQILFDNKDLEVEVSSIETEWDFEHTFKIGTNEISFTSVTELFSTEEF
jgi:hypothetical protein